MQEIYTSDQVAKILKIHPQTVLKFIREGRLKASKVGRGYRVKASDIEAFLDETSSQPVKKNTNNKKIVETEVKKVVDDEIRPNFPLEGGHYIIQ